MKISVLEVHIHNGKVGACSECPIALAIHAVVGANFEVFVGGDEAFLKHMTDAFQSRSYKLPPEAQAFIPIFDRQETKEFKPFTFELKDMLT